MNAEEEKDTNAEELIGENVPTKDTPNPDFDRVYRRLPDPPKGPNPDFDRVYHPLKKT